MVKRTSPRGQGKDTDKSVLLGYEADYSGKKLVDTIYANAASNQVYHFRQHNPNNKADYHCLYYAFARGYYGPPRTKACHARYDDIITRIRELWNHVVAAGSRTSARVNRRVIYNDMQHNSGAAGEGESIDEQVTSGEWATIDMVQLLADTFDVEILVWSPSGMTRAKEFDPPDVGMWTLQTRGDRHAPVRQINLCNYPNYGHWTFLQPIPISTSTTIDPNDPHMNNPHVSSNAIRTPLITSHIVPVPLARYPAGHNAYTQPYIRAEDVQDQFHIADIEQTVPGTAFLAMQLDRGHAGSTPSKTVGKDTGKKTSPAGAKETASPAKKETHPRSKSQQAKTPPVCRKQCHQRSRRRSRPPPPPQN